MRGRRSLIYAFVLACIFAVLSGCTSGDGLGDLLGSGDSPDGWKETSGEGATTGVLLEGDPSSPAIAALKDFVSLEGVSESDIGLDASGVEVPLTRLEMEVRDDATVGEVNDLLASMDGRIVGMIEGVPILLVGIPNPGSVEALDGIIRRLEEDPLVIFARRVRLAAGAALPANHEALDNLDKIDHHLAVRAHAAWNARGALDYSAAMPPYMVVSDLFGVSTLLSGDFNVHVLNPEDFGSASRPDPHGYHVLGVIAATYGGDTSGRGLATGIYPGTTGSVPNILVVDALRSDRHRLTIAAVEDALIGIIRGTGYGKVVNSSLQFWCETPQQVAAACSDRPARDEALLWIRKVRGSKLEDRFIHVVVAGNTKVSGDTDARYASPFAAARLITDLKDRNGNPVPPLSNTLVVENVVNSSQPPYKPVCLYEDSKYSGDLSAIGTRVWSLLGPLVDAGELTGTSMAAPQVAGVAAYVWALDPLLTASQVIDILKMTARWITPDPGADPDCSAVQPAPVIDAYLAVLALDDPSVLELGGSPDGMLNLEEARVRGTVLDVSDEFGNPGSNMQFDEHDLERFVQMFSLEMEVGDYADSRYDLNGDGRTGGATRERFDLDMDGLVESRVTQEIGGKEVGFDEYAVTDMEILCYYAYSPLYTGDPDRRNELLPASQCGVSKIAFLRVDTENFSSAIHVMDEDGSNQKEIMSMTGLYSRVLDIAWSPDGTRIAFEAEYQSYYPDIYVMDADGSNLQSVSLYMGRDSDLSWSPDGTRISFVSDRDWTPGGPLELYIVDLNDLSYTRLTNEATPYERHPDWSPDGSKIAYAKCGGTEVGCSIYSISVNGFNEIRLAYSSEGSFDYPVWSPDGSRIAFRGSGVGGCDLYVMNADGSNRVNITGRGLCPEGKVVWSPNGDKIAFAASADGLTLDIFVVDSRVSGSVTRLTSDQFHNFQPIWSSDGTRIIFSRAEDISGHPSIYVMNADGSNLTRLTNGYDQLPASQP